MDHSDDSNSGKRHHWLIRAKLDAPRQLVQLIERPELLTLLDGILGHRVGFVVAPAGFGKTTLLSQWRDKLVADGVKVAWLTIDEGDAEPHQFLSYVIFSLAVAGVDVGRLEMLAEQGLMEMSLRATLAAILEAVAGESGPVVLVLDDYHRLQSPDLDDLIGQMIAGSPPELTLVINSRIRPALDLPRMLAQGQAVEIDVEALRFSREETRRAVDAAMSDDVLEVLFERTEGWAVAVQLARLVLAGSANDEAVLGRFTGDSDHVAAYLADQVLAKLSSDIQEFLIRTSILERFNAPLANAVCERTDSWEVLRTLEPLRALLVPLDERREWFRYHHLFAECLQDLLRRRHADLLDRLHLNASLWFEAQGYVSEAVRHARLARDFDRCARLIEDAGGWELILFGGIGYLRNLLRNVPDRELARFPRLQVAKTYLHLKDGRIDEARALLDAASANPRRRQAGAAFERDLLNIGVLLSVYEDQPLTPADFEAFEARDAQVPPDDGITRGVLFCQKALTALALGRFGDAESVIQAAMRAMRQASSVLGLNYCYLHAGLAAFYRARFQLAEANFREAKRMAEDNFGADSGLKFASDVLLGALLFWRGELEDAGWADFRAALDHIEQYDGWFELYAMGLDADVAAGLARGDVGRAEAAIVRAERIAGGRGIDRLRDLALARRLSTLRLGPESANGQALAAQLAEAYPLSCWRDDPFRWRPYQDVAEALAAHDADRDRRRALQCLDDAVACCRALEAQFHLIRVLIARALVHDRTGQRTKALADVFEAARLAAPERIRQPFQATRALGPLLRAAQKEGREEALDSLTFNFISECLARSTTAAAGGPGQPALSPREQEVLAELAQGLSNKQIARLLDMTEHTVKFHLKNIFAKLKVERRTQAVAEAQRLQIIDSPYSKV